MNERKRWTVFVIKGATRGTASAWKKVSLPSGSSVRHGAVSRMHVEPSIFRVFLPRDSAPSITQHHTNTVRSPVPSGSYQPTPINFGTSLDRQLRCATQRDSGLPRPLDIRISIESRTYSTNIQENITGERTCKLSGNKSVSRRIKKSWIQD